jgi:Ca2+-binding RTX toxin-like protein
VQRVWPCTTTVLEFDPPVVPAVSDAVTTTQIADNGIELGSGDSQASVNPNGGSGTIGMTADAGGTAGAAVETQQPIIGTGGSDVVTGTAGNDTLYANLGTVTLIGKGDYDTYKIGPNVGPTTIYNAAPDGITGPVGEVDFGAGISCNQLWFVQSGKDLQVDLLGTNRQITIGDWFDNPRAQVQSFNTADGLKLDTQIGPLVAAMATYGASNPSFDPTTATQMPNDPTLQGAIAATWHQ